MQTGQPKKNKHELRRYTTSEVTSKVTREVPREAIAKYTYTESRTHGLIIENPRGYSLNMTKYKPNNPVWRKAWRQILQPEEDKRFVNAWFCFQFPIYIQEKKPGENLEEHHRKLNQKLQREFKRKIRDITAYLVEGLKDFNKA